MRRPTGTLKSSLRSSCEIMLKRLLLLSVVCGFAVSAVSGNAWADSEPIRIASKNFTESYVLAEISAQVLEAEGYSVQRRFGLGGTLICFEALANDEIDLYIE